MFTISQIAEKYQITNRQVHALIEHGYLNVSKLYRNSNNGISYLFAEEDIEGLDIYSLLAELQSHKNFEKGKHNNFKSFMRTLRHYDRFLENISSYPEADFLRTCFYLFHLNHYAKKDQEMSKQLYRLKNKVLEKMYNENPEFIMAKYLTGPDRYHIWLCDDCKDAAHAAGISYAAYIKNELFCPKCSLHTVEKEYYSLVEFCINIDEYRFTFHLPLRTASHWMKNIHKLPQGIRETGRYDDKMYLYGRSISRIEEKIFPVSIIIEKLHKYLDS